MPWELYSRQPSGWWVYVPAAGCVIGYVQRHTVTPCERQEWAAARPRGGDWRAYRDGDMGLPVICRTTTEAAQAVYDLWAADADTHAQEVPAP